MSIKLSFYFILMSYTALAGVDREMAKSVFSNKLNHSFEENLGQINYPDNKPAPEVKFVFKKGNLKIFLLKTGLVYQLEKLETDSNSLPESLLSGSFSTYRMDMELLGANPHPQIVVEGKSDDYTNYYQPNLIQTHSYQKIIYKNIYPNIDWVIYSATSSPSEERKGGVKYDFIVYPGADPSLIKLKYKNAEQIYLDQFGNLILRNRLGDIRVEAPIAFQLQDKITSNYLLNDSIVCFQIKNYNPREILIIDPQLEWSTYYGGAGTDGYCELDANRNVYLYGTTSSSTNISYNGFQNNFTNGTQMFLAKFNSNGNRLWGTYYGARSSSRASAMYPDGSILLAGAMYDTSSTYSHLGFQNTYGGGSQDGFLVKFDSSGLRLWASFYGGSGSDAISDIKIDQNNNVYITGTTTSPNGIAYNAYQDTIYVKNFPSSVQQIPNNFIARLNANGTRAWSSYFGLTGYIPSIALHGSDLIFSNTYIDTHLLFTDNSNVYFTGAPLFMAKFSALNGNRIVSKSISLSLTSFLTFDYRGMFLHKNSIYALCAIGTPFAPTLSTGFKKTHSGGAKDALILRIDTNFNITWSSYLGGNFFENPLNIAFDKRDNYYIIGQTTSTTGIHYRGIKSTLPGIQSSFCYKISAKDSLIWSTYVGGNNVTNTYSIKADKSDNVYIAGQTTSTSGLAYQGHQNTNSVGCAFLMKISCAKIDTIRKSICIGDSVLFRAKYYKQIGFYTDSLLTWDICDSLTTLDLTFLRNDTTYLYDTICSGSSYVWNGLNRTASGVYRDTLINNVGCDSFLILNLLVKRTDTMQVYDTLCNNLPKSFNGQNLTLAGVYRDTLINNVGCDSQIIYHFIPKPAYETPLLRAICAGDSSLFGGKYYKQGGIYYDTLKTIRNCDSVLKLTLTINPLDTNKQTQTICRGKSYNFYSQVLTSQGTYIHKFTNRNGCDSLILLTLALKDTSTYALTRTICKNQFYSFNNQNLNTAGIYRDTLTNAAGCDSFITLTLLTNGTVSNTIEIIRCHGDIYQGYTQSGTYVQTLTSHLGCDSLLTINLTYLPTTEYKTITHNKCGAFHYGSHTYTQNDSFTETINNYLNCDSIVTKHLVYITEPQPKFLADKTIEFCEEIIHKGQLKTASFFTQDTIKSLEFPYCDSIYQPYYYRRENRPVLTAISKQIDTVIKGETTNIKVSGAQNYRWTSGEQSSAIRPQINEDKTFEVTAWNLADCEEKMQFSIYAIDQPLIDFPTAFSPNGDGLNDYFTPNLSGNISIDYFQIFNRWGEKVYEHNPSSKGWDGSYQGMPAANGVYSYSLRYSYLGRYFTKTGEVMMVR